MELLQQRRLVGVAALLLLFVFTLAACAPDPTQGILSPELGSQMIAAAQADDAAAEPVAEEPVPTLAELSDEEIYAGLDDAVATAIQTGDPANGETLSLVNGCIGCHALDPAAQMTGPTWYNMGDTAVTRGDAGPAAYLHNSIVAPNAYVVNDYPQGVMPATYADTISEEDLGDIVAYLLTLHGQ
jgi:mono/diheme cytochrome c family protein